MTSTTTPRRTSTDVTRFGIEGELSVNDALAVTASREKPSECDGAKAIGQKMKNDSGTHKRRRPKAETKQRGRTSSNQPTEQRHTFEPIATNRHERSGREYQEQANRRVHW
jgi:hypothetical protein